MQSLSRPADACQKARQLTLAWLIKAGAGLGPPCSRHLEAGTRAARCRIHACPRGSSPQIRLLPLRRISNNAAVASHCCHNHVMACMQYCATVWLLQQDGRCYSWGCVRHKDYMCLQAQLCQAGKHAQRDELHHTNFWLALPEELQALLPIWLAQAIRRAVHC